MRIYVVLCLPNKIAVIASIHVKRLIESNLFILFAFQPGFEEIAVLALGI